MTETLIILTGKKYKRRDGVIVKVRGRDGTDRPDPWRVYSNENTYLYNVYNNGRYNKKELNDRDLIEEVTNSTPDKKETTAMDFSSILMLQALSGNTAGGLGSIDPAMLMMIMGNDNFKEDSTMLGLLLSGIDIKQAMIVQAISKSKIPMAIKAKMLKQTFPDMTENEKQLIAENKFDEFINLRALKE